MMAFHRNQNPGCVRKEFISPAGLAAADRRIVSTEQAHLIRIGADESASGFGALPTLGGFAGVPGSVAALILIAEVVLAACIGVDVVGKLICDRLLLLVEDVAAGDDGLCTAGFMSEFRGHFSIDDGCDVLLKRKTIDQEWTPSHAGREQQVSSIAVSIKPDDRSFLWTNQQIALRELKV